MKLCVEGVHSSKRIPKRTLRPIEIVDSRGLHASAFGVKRVEGISIGEFACRAYRTNAGRQMGYRFDPKWQTLLKNANGHLKA